MHINGYRRFQNVKQGGSIGNEKINAVIFGFNLSMHGMRQILRFAYSDDFAG